MAEAPKEPPAVPREEGTGRGGSGVPSEPKWTSCPSLWGWGRSVPVFGRQDGPCALLGPFLTYL